MKATKAILTAILLLAGLTAAAESTWTVTNSNGQSNTFTIKRSETGYAQKVLYRTVSLSAYAGQHYTARYGELEFLANENTKTITVTELTPSGAYAFYKSGTTVKYGFEVTDRAGFRLAYAERSKTWGTSVPASGIFDEKSVTVNSGTITVTDGGFTQAYNEVPISTYFTNAAAQAYLVTAGAELRMKVEFEEAEKEDGYQHIQLLVNQTSNCDNSANHGDPGTPSYSRYLASFAHKPGSTLTSYAKVCFPLTSASDNCSEIDPAWNFSPYSNTVGKLYTQKFKSGYRADDGKLIIAKKNELSALDDVGIRFDASGDNSDTWYAKNTIAKIQAVDLTNPTLTAISVNPGRHAKGNPFYVSVAFSEIVTSTAITLTTSWGTMTLEAGSGTNVLTFKGIIKADAESTLSISGKNGTITDLAGKSFDSSITVDNFASLDSDLAYSLSDFQQRDGRYLITCHDDLHGLAGYVNGGNNASGLTFHQVTDLTFPHSDSWNNSSSTENNYTAIGNENVGFQGTYDGDGHTISGIRIYKGGNGDSDYYQGLFGCVLNNGIVRSVNLTDTRITGYRRTGGIAGKTFSCTIEDCTVGADVCIHAKNINTYYHGGIVGLNQAEYVRRCISRARLTAEDASGCYGFGGIVGFCGDKITDCIADGVVIPNVYGRGAIVGYKGAGTLTRNFYRGCTVAGVANAIGVGQGTSTSSTETSDDVTGACALYAVTLPEHSSMVRSKMADLPGTNNRTYTTGADIAGVPYAAASMGLRLSYDSTSIPDGYVLSSISVEETTSGTPVALIDNGDYTYNFTMPAADVTVSANVVPIIRYIDANGDEQTRLQSTCTQIVSGTTSYGNAENTEAWYYVSGNVTIGGTQGVSFLDQAVHIILCDGATLTSNATTADFYGIDVPNGSLVIYAQAGGGGSIVATAKDMPAIHSLTNMDLNGGNISASTPQGAIGVCTDDNGSLTIRRGNITATGETTGIRGFKGITILGGTVRATGSNIGLFSISGNISILGGNVDASGTSYSSYGIFARELSNIILGCSSPSDRITCSRYSCHSLTIATGQTLTDGTSTYTGTLSSDQITDIGGRTLRMAFDPAEGTVNITAHQATLAGQSRYWTTFYHPLWNYALPAGAQAFILKTDKVLYCVGNGKIVPAGCAVVIMADSASLTLSATNSNAPNVSGNILLGTSAAMAAPAGTHVLSKVSENFGFFGFTGEIPANKAYYVE